MRLRFAPLICLLLPLAAAADEPGDVVVSGESRPTAARLGEARKLIAQKKWPEAVAVLRSLSESGTYTT